VALCYGVAMIRLFSVILLLVIAAPLAAETPWQVESGFSKKKARKDISGAACGPTVCFAVNDETHYIQSFRIEGDRLRTGKRVNLLDDKVEIDAEAIAYSDGVFYITGSHGLSRKKAKLKPAPFTVFRLMGLEVQTSIRLGKAIETAPILGEFSKQPLNENGANIEGLAAVGDALFFGFRGPSVSGKAVILETSASALFSNDELPVTIHTVPLGEGIGIRDMAAVGDGILLLTGPVNTHPHQFSVVLWNPETKALEARGAIPAPTDGKPEGLLVLGEKPTAYRVLVFYDGLRNGAPAPIVLEKP